MSARLRQAEEEVSPFFAQSLDLLCVAGLDGYFKRLTPAWQITLGWTLAELQGRPFLDFVHPDDRVPTVAEAERRQAMVAEYPLDFPEACRCLLDDAKVSLNHLSVPPRHQQYVRTSTLAERAFEEERRRPKVIPHLWDAGG